MILSSFLILSFNALILASALLEVELSDVSYEAVDYFRGSF